MELKIDERWGVKKKLRCAASVKAVGNKQFTNGEGVREREIGRFGGLSVLSYKKCRAVTAFVAILVY